MDHFFRGKIAAKGGMCMMIGTVIGTIGLSRALAGAAEKRFVQVRCGYALMTALDTLGVEPGDVVLLCAGDRAGVLCPEFPVDAVVLGTAGKNG